MTTDLRLKTLNTWNAQLQAVNEARPACGGGQAGLPSPAQVVGNTGLQVMTALLEGDLPHPPMALPFGPAKAVQAESSSRAACCNMPRSHRWAGSFWLRSCQ